MLTIAAHPPVFLFPFGDIADALIPILVLLVALTIPALLLFWATRRLSPKHPRLRWSIVITVPILLVGLLSLALSYKGALAPRPLMTLTVPNVQLPDLPWPPPTPSARIVLPGSPFRDVATFGQFAGILDEALDQAGYVEKSYFGVPHGLAIVTQMERTYGDGRPDQGADRWSMETSYLRRLSLGEYLSALFSAQTGYYRVIIFVVTDEPFGGSKTSMTPNEADSLLSHGFNTLPPRLIDEPLPSHSSCTALIYEFRKPDGKPPEVVVPGHLDGRTHLIKSGLWAALRLP